MNGKLVTGKGGKHLRNFTLQKAPGLPGEGSPQKLIHHQVSSEKYQGTSRFGKHAVQSKDQHNVLNLSFHFSEGHEEHFDVEEGKSSVVEFKPAPSTSRQGQHQLHEYQDNSIIGHLEAAMASVTEMRRQSAEAHSVEPAFNKLGQRQFELMSNSLRRSLMNHEEVVNLMDPHNESNFGVGDPFSGNRMSERDPRTRYKSITKTAQISPISHGHVLMENIPSITEESIFPMSSVVLRNQHTNLNSAGRHYRKNSQTGDRAPSSKSQIDALHMQFDNYKRQTDSRLNFLEDTVRRQKETISVLMTAFDMINQMSQTHNSTSQAASIPGKETLTLAA